MALAKKMGFMIGVEGIDAAGKQTQSALLEEWLRNRGLKVSSLSFPDYETPIGKEIRAFLSGQRDFVPELQHMLFAANRWEKAPLIRELRDADRVLIVNRYSESNLVYGVANGLPLDWLATLEEGLPKADLVVVLDASPAGLLSRRPGSSDYYERNAGLQSRAQALYRRLSHRYGWSIVDASEGIETVHRAVIGVVGERMRRTTKRGEG